MTSWKGSARRYPEPSPRRSARATRLGSTPGLAALEGRRLLAAAPALVTVLPIPDLKPAPLKCSPPPSNPGGPGPLGPIMSRPGPPVEVESGVNPSQLGLHVPAPDALPPGGPVPIRIVTVRSDMTVVVPMGAAAAARPAPSPVAGPNLGPAEPGPSPEAAVATPNPVPPTAGPTPHPLAPHDRPLLAQAPVAINGTWSSELALADPTAGAVTVVAGDRVVFRLDGLDHPSAVKLADLNNDGVADLIVADSGRDQVLVFPGLASGGFGGERNAGAGYAVGVDPVDLTVGDLDGDHLPDLLVTNRGSNDVSILKGRGTAASWTLAPSGRLAAGVAPVRTLIYTPEGQTRPIVVICNNGSNNIFVYQTGPGGALGDQPSHVIPVGDGPSDMVVGPIAHRSEVDMVTVDSGSHALSYVPNIMGNRPTRQVIAATGSSILSALPFTSSTTGLMDLLVARSDGRLSIFQASPDGVELTAVANSADLGVVTAIAASAATDGTTLGLFEAIGSGDLIAEYRLDLGSFLSPTADDSAAALDDGLTWELIPAQGGSMLDLVGVLWNGPATRTGLPTPPTPSPANPTLTTSAGPTMASIATATASGGDVLPSGEEADAEPSRSAEAEVDGWVRYVLGLDAAFDSLAAEVAALSPADLDTGAPGQAESPSDASARGRLIARWGDPAETQSPSPDATDPTPRHEVSESIPAAPVTTRSSWPSTLVPTVVGSAVAVRLLISASPPRPPRIRPERRPGAVAPWPELVPPNSPHA